MLLCRSGAVRLANLSAGRLCCHQHHLPRKKASSTSSSTSPWNRRGKAILGGGVVSLAATIGVASVSVQDAKDAKGEDNSGDQLPLRYDAGKVKRYWDKRPVQVFMRSAEVWWKFTPFLSKLILWECLIRGKIRRHEGLQRKYAARLREILTELGPCFVKLGQALSIRPDILPNAVLLELQKLCDAVPSFPNEVAMAVMSQELGRDPREVFKDLDENTEPIAAASLGQVYRLRLRSDSSVVAVKVQRPDMAEAILKDLYILRNMARIIEKVKSIATYQRPYDVALIDTFAEASLLELDYLNEAANQEQFIKDLVPKMGGQVYVPKVYKEYTTRKVLVTEWIYGEQLAKSPPDVIQKLTKVGVECFLKQLLETGFFHADPHPGNLFVTPEGKLALLDFGLCAHVPLPDTKVLTLAVVHLMQGDVRGLIDDAIKLGFLPEDVNMEELYPDVQRVYNSGQLAITETMVEEQGFKFKAVVKRRKRFMAVSLDLNRIFFEYPFLVPDYFALITRAMIVLEGIAVTGNPEFDLFSAAYPYTARRAVSLFGLSSLTQIAKEVYLAEQKRKQEEEQGENAIVGIGRDNSSNWKRLLFWWT